MKTNINNITKEIARLNPIELNELSSALLEYNISATMYRFGGTLAEESREFDVVITDAGKTKLMLVKTVKELLDLGLREAKDIVDSVPCIIKEFVGYEEALLLKTALVDAGATIELKSIR